MKILGNTVSVVIIISLGSMKQSESNWPDIQTNVASFSQRIDSNISE